MRSTMLAVSCVFIATILARPQADWSDWPINGTGVSGSYSHGTDGPSTGISGAHGKCLDDSDIQMFIDGYTYLLEHPGGDKFDQTANAILSVNLTVWSDSINAMGGTPLGTPTWASLPDFIRKQAFNPPLPTVSTLQAFRSCDQISWRWNATGVVNQTAPIANPLPVVGLMIFNVDVASKKINTVWSEFNNLVFAQNYGSPKCQAA